MTGSMQKFLIGTLLLALTVSTASGKSEIIYTRPLPYPPSTRPMPGVISETDGFIYRQIFSTLINMRDNGDLEPGLAESWRISPDAKEYTFVIRKGIHFHDGSTLTLEDIETSLERDKNKVDIVAAAFDDIKTIQADEKNFSIKIFLKHPSRTIPVFLADETASIAKRGQALTQLNGTGPFEFEKRSPSLLVLRKNDGYFGLKAQIDELRLPIVNKQTAMRMFSKGQVDDLTRYFLTAKDRATLGGSCHWEFAQVPTFRFLVANRLRNPILKNLNNRKCLFSIINRRQLVKSWGDFLLMRRLLPLGIMGSEFIPKVKTARCSPQALRRLVRLTQRFPIQLVSNKQMKTIVQPVISQLTSSGLNVNVKQIGDGMDTYLREIESNSIDLYVARATMSTPQIEEFIYAFDDRGSPIHLNIDGQFRDRILAKIAMSTDTRMRARLVSQYFERAQDEAVYLPVMQFIFSGCYSNKWSHVKPPSVGYFRQCMNEIRIKN